MKKDRDNKKDGVIIKKESKCMRVKKNTGNSGRRTNKKKKDTERKRRILVKRIRKRKGATKRGI